MDTRRVVLYAALAFVMYALWSAWHHDYPDALELKEASVRLPEQERFLPEMKPATKTEAVVTSEQHAPSQTIHVSTDVLSLKIDLQHGDVVQAGLLDYPVSLNNHAPIQLLEDKFKHRYIASSSLLTTAHTGVKSISMNFKATQPAYQLLPDQKSLTVVLHGQTSTGLSVEKTFHFTRGSYLIKVDYAILNQGTEAWTGYLNTQLLQSSPPEEKGGLFQIGTYTGASYSDPGVHRYQKVPFAEMTKKNLNVKATGGWIAMQQHYFLASWIPNAHQKHIFYTRASNDTYSIGAISHPITILPDSKVQLGSQLYLGPELTHVLRDISPGLDLTVDYGWFWFISSFLFSLMKLINDLIGNWGWSIVFVTVLIKLAFYKLSASSYRSMANMRKLQPKLQAFRERYGEDKAKISQATMELYKQEKINPLGGCLPILIQIPVFIALYWVLIESVELRQAPFIFWINDLAMPDPYHVLPVIMGITMLLQQRLNPAPPDPMQAKMMMLLPLFFTALFWNFPSGLVLYWIVNNILSMLQQWWITKKYA